MLSTRATYYYAPRHAPAIFIPRMICVSHFSKITTPATLPLRLQQMYQLYLFYFIATIAMPRRHLSRHYRFNILPSPRYTPHYALLALRVVDAV